jgi:hypothetical protein
MKVLKALSAVLPASFLVLALGMGATPALGQEEIYKWVDEDGVTHFSARPPEGVEYQRINTLSNAVSTVSPQTVGESENLDPGETGTGVLPELPEVDVQQPDPALVQERCEQARSNLSWMTQRVQINRENEQGELERMTEEERQQMIQETQAFIDEWC